MAAWHPTTFLRYEGSVRSSTGVARVVTDAGKAYLKAMGNPEGPHALAREYVGTSLARCLGLPVLDFDILTLDPCDEVTLGAGHKAQPGPAFVTRAVDGHPWSGDNKELRHVENRGDISGLVVFDTWIRNHDRCAPETMGRRPHYDNVFLTSEGAQAKGLRLLAIDHTHCFMPGERVTRAIANIGCWRDEAIYGIFPQFVPYVNQERVEGWLRQLRQLDREVVCGIMDCLPPTWEVDAGVRSAWMEFILQRSQFVADTLIQRLGPLCWPDGLFDNRQQEGT